jgi:uncharacterized surface protein with fasciclin (FAS1) repeats
MKNKILAIFAILTIVSVGIVQADDTTPDLNIVETAIQINQQTGEFSILIAALQAADPTIIEKLTGKCQYTVFAPTDQAFTNLLTELQLTSEELLANQELLTTVLKYHITRGRQNAEQILEKKYINTLIRGRNGFLKQNNAVLTDNQERTSNIIQTDVEASNGIIHVIDTVVLP